MISIASRMLRSPAEKPTRPSGPTLGGKPIPRPRTSPASIASLGLHRDGEADLHERQPPEDHVEDDQEDEQHDQRADRDDRNRHRADPADAERLLGGEPAGDEAQLPDPAELVAELVGDDEPDVALEL